MAIEKDVKLIVYPIAFNVDSRIASIKENTRIRFFLVFSIPRIRYIDTGSNINNIIRVINSVFGKFRLCTLLVSTNNMYT